MRQATAPIAGNDPAELEALASQAEAWASEPFLHAGEDAAQALAPGSARRIALEAAGEEIAAGKKSPSPAWRTRFGLMLGLERVLAAEEPALASGLTLRPHQVDALTGMLSELIARNQVSLEETNGWASAEEAAAAEAEEAEEVEELELGDEAADPDDCPAQDPGAERRFRFRHPTASGKTVAAAGFVEAAQSLGVLILTHRRLLVDQFNRDLSEGGYKKRLAAAVMNGDKASRSPLTIQTYAWFARHHADISRTAYQLVICDEAHTALGEKTSAAIRAFAEPLYIGMTATEELIAKQVSDVFPASVDDLPLKDASRRGLVAPLRCLRVPPSAAVNAVPIVGGDFDQQLLAQTLDHQALNQAAAGLYRQRFGDSAGIVYAAGVEHAYNLAQEFRAVGLKAEAVSGKTPPVRLAETLAAYERGEINVLVNAQLLAEGWNSPRATVCMHLAPTASKRVYQQRIGRVMRTYSRKEAGIVVDFVPKAAPHSERVVSLHSLLDADFYREGARVTPAPRRRRDRRARRTLSPAAWLVPVSPDPARRVAVIRDEWQRIDPSFLGSDEQALWGHIAGREVKPQDVASHFERLTKASSSVALIQFLATCAAENPERSLRLKALVDRAALPMESSTFDDLLTLVTHSPSWKLDRTQGVKALLRALAEEKPQAHEQILARWAWQLAAVTREHHDRYAGQSYPEAKRLLGLLANARGKTHEGHVVRLVKAAQGLPLPVACALLASAQAYTPQAERVLADGRDALGTAAEVARALGESLPEPKRKKRRRKKKPAVKTEGTQAQGQGEAKRPRRKKRRKPRTAGVAPVVPVASSSS
jgi:ribonuclease E